jgi:hypothetical protein
MANAQEAADPAPPREEPMAPSPEYGSLSTVDPSADAHPQVTQRVWPNRPLLTTGLVVLGGTYAASAIVAGTSDREADQKLYYPVVGPWLDLNDRGCDELSCSDDTLPRVLLVGDGVLQGVGALGVLLSLVVPETTTKEWYLIGNRDLSISPAFGSMTGLTAVGRF